jgi:putative phosphoribosyl transferase
MLFRDRADAGRQLAARLTEIPRAGLVVLALPRGGVPVAFEVAVALAAPLDVILVRKLGVPQQPELAMGAIGENGVRVIDDEVVRLAQVTPSVMAAVEAREADRLARGSLRFRGIRERVPLAGRTALIVDDGIATGATARAACQVARAQGAARVVVATPVAPRGVIARLHADADDVIVVESPEPFWAIGRFYTDFSQTSDDEVVRLLERAARSRPEVGDPRDVRP